MHHAIAVDEPRHAAVGVVGHLAGKVACTGRAAQCIRRIVHNTPTRVGMARQRAIRIVGIAHAPEPKFGVLLRLLNQQASAVVLVAADHRQRVAGIGRADGGRQAVWGIGPILIAPTIREAQLKQAIARIVVAHHDTATRLRRFGIALARAGQGGARCRPGKIAGCIVVLHGGAGFRLDGLAQLAIPIVDIATGQLLAAIPVTPVDREWSSERIALDLGNHVFGLGNRQRHFVLRPGIGQMPGRGGKTSRIGHADAEIADVIGRGNERPELRCLRHADRAPKRIVCIGSA
ncbi:hypothetical protein LMG19144_03796 [Xanthomonas arboricola pv. fragariae]|nr:hypothetical protein LMG19144_03796 [Xanthomonas arboricola pv. fragariae]